MEFRILGPLEVRSDGRMLALGGAKQRALLAILLLNANEVVSSDRLIDELWGEEPPDTAVKGLQGYVSGLRKALDRADVILTRPPGYVIQVEPEQLDLERFERLRASAREALAAGDPERASTTLREALALWRGAPLADVAYESFAQNEIGRLEGLRLATLEERIEADLALGLHADVVAELESLIRDHPLREPLRAHLMLALYRSGRQAEALEAYRQSRHVLVEQLGIEPGRELRELHDSILRQDPELETAGEPEAEPGSTLGRGVFVGREAEMAELLSALADALDGRGRLALVSGEPGIGKSRLTEELVAHARARGARVLVGRCWEAGGAPAFWPWVQSLRAYIDERDADDLRGELRAGAGELAQLLPELRQLLPDTPDAPVLDPDAARFRLFDAAASFLKRAAGERPIVLVIDDLHAADEPSLLLLQFVTRSLSEARLLIIGAYRDVDPTLRDPLASTLAELTREPVTRRVLLTGLTEPDVHEYVSQTAGHTPDPVTSAAIHARTEGNALFVDELTRLLIAEGALEERASGAVGIPQGVHAVIGHRIGRLSEDCRQTLTTACVLGREFAVEALARMAWRPLEEVLDVLDEALEARVVSEARGAPARLRFSHALTRDTLYDELTPARRLRLHTQAGEALEALYADDEEPHLTELAHHFAQAAPAAPERAVDYARRAGDRAGMLLAYEEAARLYRMALEALALGGRRDETGRCELLLALGDAEARGGTFGAAQETFVRAADIARGVGAADLLGRAALGYGGRHAWFRAGKDRRLIPLLEDALEAQPKDTGIRAMLLARLAGAMRDHRVHERRAALAAEAVDIARRLGGLGVLAWVIDGSYASITWPRDSDRWLAMARELREVGEQLGDMEKVFSGHLHGFSAFMVRGEVDAADRELVAAGTVARELRQPLPLWLLTVAAIMRALHAGRFEEAERLVGEELALGPGLTEDTTYIAQYVAQLHRWALGRERGVLAEAREELERFVAEHPLFMSRCMLVSLYSEVGEEAKAVVELERLAAEGFEDLELRCEWFFGASLLAEACERLGEPAHAPLFYEVLLPYRDNIVITHPEVDLGSAARYLGLLASVMGRTDDAVSHYEAALITNERLGARPWLARTQADLARTLLARGAPGDAERARELAGMAHETFETLGMVEPAERLRRGMAPTRLAGPSA